MNEFQKGAKTLFDILQGMAANPGSYKPELMKKHDFEAEIVLRWLEDAYESVDPEESRKWRGLSKVCADLATAENEIVELKKLCARAADVIQFPLAKFTVNVDGLIQQLRNGSNLPTALYDNIKEKL